MAPLPLRPRLAMLGGVLVLLLGWGYPGCVVGGPSGEGKFVGPSGEGEFVAPPPATEVETDGGSVKLWSRDLLALRDASITSALVTVEPHSLALPMYSDCQELSYVTQGGCGYVGLITPLGIPTAIRYIEKGDAVAIPRGWASWVWNDGDEALQWVDVAEVSPGPNRGGYTPFELAGREPEKETDPGGILHGFSREVLSQAFDVGKEAVEKLLTSQQGAAFVKLSKEDEEGLRRVVAHQMQQQEASNVFPRFKQSLETLDPDWQVEGAGQLWAASARSLPVLKHIGISATRFRLEVGAMLAPHWHPTGIVIMYILRGCGRMEAVYPGGKPALRKDDLKQGDYVALPADYPSTVVAGEEGLEWIEFVGHPKPEFAFLAGRNSIFKGVPLKILEASFGVSEELERNFYDKRRGADEIVFFPPRSST